MNRERDFHKKSAGVIVNGNSKDFHRARKRNRIMKSTNEALGDDGILKKIENDVVKINNAPSRAEKRVKALEVELELSKKENERMSTTINDAAIASQQIILDAENIKKEFEDLKQLVHDIIGSK